MTEQKQPQSGEWWQKDLTRLFIIGTKKNGLAVGETEFGTLIPFLPIHDWQYLPDCDSFDWQPEVWPKLYVHCDADCDWCVEQYKVDRIRVHRVTGVEDQPWVAMYSTNIADGTWIKVTEAEALARVKPVESPDDWVTQDRVPPRHRIDQVQWSDWESSRWMDTTASGWFPAQIHGYRDEDDDTVLSVRCRRKDLPVMPSPEETPTNQQLFEMIANLRDQMAAMAKPIEVKSQPKPVTVRLVCSTEDIGSVIWRMHDDPGIAGEAEIKHDGYKFYVEVQR